MTTANQPKLFSGKTDARMLACNSVERFRLHDGRVYRFVLDSTGTKHQTSYPVSPENNDESDLASLFEQALLHSGTVPRRRGDASPPITIVDLFSGCGGMTLGVKEAARAINRRAVAVFAADHKAEALDVYQDNFPEAVRCPDPLEEVLDGDLGDDPTENEKERLLENIGTRPIDFLVGGPPCQGHSNLNNHTRREDPKNSLMSRMVRCAELLKPTHIIIENVPQALNDKNRVVQTSMEVLQDLDYVVDQRRLDLSQYGVPQTRKRLVIVATKHDDIYQGHEKMFRRIDALRQERRDLRWAIGDLEENGDGVTKEKTFDTASEASKENKRRINYLHDHKESFDLPNTERPPCHQKGTTYKAVYGRLAYDEPAPTITTGFGSIGQGRYVHPDQRRTLTPHEAARIQYFPDWFRFGEDTSRSALHRLIGNAVPWKLTYAIALLLLTTPDQ